MTAGKGGAIAGGIIGGAVLGSAIAAASNNAQCGPYDPYCRVPIYGPYAYGPAYNYGPYGYAPYSPYWW